MADKPAAEAGLKEGDRVISLDEQAIGSWNDFVNGVKDNTGDAITVVAQRGDENRYDYDDTGL